MLDSDKVLHVAKGPRIELWSELSGPDILVKTGAGEVRLWNVKNSYSGGMHMHGGTLTVEFVAGALSSGPVTVEEGTVFRLDAVKGANPLTFNGGAFDASGHWNADIQLNHIVLLSRSLALNN